MPIGWEITVVILCMAVVALAIVVLGLMRQVTPALERAVATAGGSASLGMGPAVGSPLPHFAAAGADGMVTGAQLRGRSVVLLFLSRGCGPCEILAQEMSSAGLGHLARQLVIVTGPGDPQALRIPAGLSILTEQDRQVSDALSVSGTPFAIAVDPDGIVKAASVPNTVGQLEDVAAFLKDNSLTSAP